jgi:undecaprenyl diphosphate synthase
VPDPDLIIRPGGEVRLSNYLMWQAAYAELYFCDTLWPDFTPDEYETILRSFGNRERRFGGRNE